MAEEATLSKPAGSGFQQILIRLLHNATVEITPRSAEVAASLRDMFDPGTDIYVTFIPGSTQEQAVEAAVAVREHGFNPVPHIAARAIADTAALDRFLSQLRDRADVTDALVIGGDLDKPRGEFASALELLESGLFKDKGFRRIGIAGYPEGHPKVGNEELMRALADKIACVQQAGLEPFVVTQFCFTAEPVLDWLAATREAGFDVPVRVGVAGPASVTTLGRYAIRCGIGNSLRALQSKTNLIGRLISEPGPDDLLRDLATGLAGAPDARVAGIHFFPFGGLGKTSDWIAAALSRLYAQITAASA